MSKVRNQFEPVDGDMLKSLGLKFVNVSLDRVEFFKGEYAGFVKAHKEIGILFNPYIFVFVFYDQEFHVLLPLMV
ncbi:MAG: hypothetical protein JRD04_08265 [Deltaproteobacteria bacterium]|nr:hypothetical protein [Deltaproteobacteria bacterium]